MRHDAHTDSTIRCVEWATQRSCKCQTVWANDDNIKIIFISAIFSLHIVLRTQTQAPQQLPIVLLRTLIFMNGRPSERTF